MVEYKLDFWEYDADNFDRYLDDFAISQENTGEENLIEARDISDSEQDDCSAIKQNANTPARDRERIYGCKHFWLRQFGYNKPLQIDELPKFAKYNTLQLIAASQYSGQPELLPRGLASFVSRVRATKILIFGTHQASPKTEDYYIICRAIENELITVRNEWLYEWDYAKTHFLYNYRVSFNGIFCGTIPGPSQITNFFIRWIHLRLAIFNSLRVKNLRRRWITSGFKVYRFMPIPYVTVLRLFLYDSETTRQVLLHITRQID